MTLEAQKEELFSQFEEGDNDAYHEVMSALGEVYGYEDTPTYWDIADNIETQEKFDRFVEASKDMFWAVTQMDEILETFIEKHKVT